MIFNFSSRKKKSEEIDNYPDTPILTAEEKKTEGKDYRKFSTNSKAAELLSAQYITVVTADDNGTTAVFIVNHNDEEFSVTYDNTKHKRTVYEITKARTFNCKELALALEEANIVTPENRNMRVVPGEQYGWLPKGATIYQLTAFVPNVHDSLSPAQKELAKEKVAVS